MTKTVNYLNIFKSISISVIYFIFGIIVFYAFLILEQKNEELLINMGE